MERSTQTAVADGRRPYLVAAVVMSAAFALLLAWFLPRPDGATFAFWDVQGLADEVEDPAAPDEGVPDAGGGRLARRIAWIDPHLIGLAGIESRAVLEELFAQPALARKRYRLAHVEVPGGRDVALAFRAPFSLREAVLLRGGAPVRLHPSAADGSAGTPGLLEVQLEVDGEPLTVLVAAGSARGDDLARAVVDRIAAEAAAAGREADVLRLGGLDRDAADRAATAHGMRDDRGVALVDGSVQELAHGDLRGPGSHRPIHGRLIFVR